MPTLQRSFGSFAAFSVEAWLDDNNKSEVKKKCQALLPMKLPTEQRPKQKI